MAILATHPASTDECNINLSSPTTNPGIIESFRSPELLDDSIDIVNVHLKCNSSTKEQNITKDPSNLQLKKNENIVDTVLKEFEKSNTLGVIPSIDKSDPQIDYEDGASSEQLDIEDPLHSEIELDISHKVSNESKETADEAMDTEERESLSTNISTNFKIDRNRDVVKKNLWSLSIPALHSFELKLELGKTF